MMESIVLALIAIIAAIIPALFKLLNDSTKALNAVASASEKVAEATRRSAQEAKQRNGHLGDQNIQITQLITNQNRDVTEIKNSNKKIADVLSNSAIIAAEDRDILTGGTTHIRTSGGRTPRSEEIG